MSSASPRRLVLAGDRTHYTSDQQFAPILRHAPALARRFGFVVEFTSFEALKAAGPRGLDGAAALGVMFDYDADPRHVRALLDSLLRPARQIGVPIILFDGDDDLGVLWKDALSLADLTVKKHAHRDRAAYGRPTIGKSNLTDYIATTYGRSFADDILPCSDAVPASEVSKIRVGWNIALDDKIHDLARDLPAPDHDRKDIDVLCRASVAPSAWIHPMRHAVVERAGALADRYRVHTPTDRVPAAAYYSELSRSRISLSPFGYGEICWRDFESILSGALLMKPSMAHVETAPNLFVPGETYVPVAWDYSDLGEVARRYLEDEPLRRRIAEAARARLLAALSRDAFLERFEETVVAPLSSGDAPFNSPPEPSAVAAI